MWFPGSPLGLVSPSEDYYDLRQPNRGRLKDCPPPRLFLLHAKPGTAAAWNIDSRTEGEGPAAQVGAGQDYWGVTEQPGYPAPFRKAKQMHKEDYTEIKKAVEEAGFFTTFYPSGEDDVWIVLVSHCTEGRLHGNSFQVSLKAGRWYLVTWSPVFYLVPLATDLATLCLDCLRASRFPIPEVPPDIASRYGLLEVSEEDYDRP